MKVGSNINLAAQLLAQGKLVAIPTETVYGLAANAFNANAVAHIYTVKKRPQFNPLIIHSNTIEKFINWGITFNKDALKLAEAFMPGPITLVLPTSENIPQIVNAGHSAVAIRIPNHPLTLELLALIDFPVAAPSANPSGYVSPTNAQHVLNQLENEVDYILDGGPCNVGLESTIISFADPTPKLLRYGGLAIELIENVLHKKLDKGAIINNDDPMAPGMLSKHYATKTPLVLGQISNYLKIYNPKDIGTICFNKPFDIIPENQQLVLAPDGSLETAATNLFAAMRMADNLNVKIIIAEPLPNQGLGLAINDRLKRASAGN